MNRGCGNCVYWAEVDGRNVGLCGCVERTRDQAEDGLVNMTGGDYFCGSWHRFAHEVLRYVGDPDGVLAPKLDGDVGYDLVVSETTIVEPHSFASIPHDVKVGLPKGHWGLILARSGTNIAGKLMVLPGCIDTGYTGQLFALVHNLSGDSVQVQWGTRVCQLVLVQACVFPLVHVGKLGDSERGDAGFGSTGGNNGEAHNPNHTGG